MINANEMNVGDSAFFGDGEWNDSKRELLDIFNNYANSQDPRWQFQVERCVIGDKSHNPPKRDQYIITRTR
jgi:Uma2 family endonuclease